MDGGGQGAWFETRAKGALLTMTNIHAIQDLRHGEGDRRERLEPRTLVLLRLTAAQR